MLNSFKSLLLLSLIAVNLSSTTVADEHKKAAEILPDSVIACATIESPLAIVNTILEHPIAAEMQGDPVFSPLFQSQQLAGFKAGLGVFQASVGMRWRTLVAELFQDGVTIAFDAETSGIAFLTRASSNEILQTVKESVFSFVRAGKLAGAENDPIKEAEYKGFEAARFNDDLVAAIVNDWLVVSNKPDFGKAIIDRYVEMEGQLATLAEKPNYLAAAESVDANDSDAWAYVDIQAIRESGTAKEFYAGKTENILAEVLLGGVVSNLQHANYATFKFDLSASGISLALCTPYQENWIPEEREYFFGPDGKGSAPAVIKLPGQILSLATHRNLSEMWLRAPDLMVDSAVEDLDQADSQLSLFFSGQDFAEDFLASFEPALRFYVGRPDFEKMKLKPAIKVPAFALELQMRTPEETQRTMRRLYLNFVGFINIISAMQGQPQFDFDFDEDEQTKYLIASFVELPDVPVATSNGVAKLDSGPINYNFSPTLAMQGNRLVISSTTQLARQLATGVENEAANVHEAIENTRLTLEASPILSMLQDNFDQLVSQNMLEKGHSREEAEAELGLLLKLLGYLDSGRLSLSTEADTLRLKADVKVKQLTSDAE